MKQLKNWESTTAATYEDSQKLPAGCYKCIIKAARCEQTRTGKEQLALDIDIADDNYSEFTGFYAKKYQSSSERYGGNSKWGCTFRQLVEDKEGNTNPFFKGLVTVIQRWNSGYTWDFNERRLVGKTLAVLFREEEYISTYDGEVKRNTKPLRAVSPEAYEKGVEAPPPKLLEEYSKNGYLSKPTEEIPEEKMPWD